MPQINYLLEIQGYNLTSNAVETLYFSRDDFTTTPDDSPADRFYDGRINGSLRFQSSLFGSARLTGMPTVSVGSIELINLDGGLDYLDNYAFGGRQLTIYRMVDNNFTSRTTWLSGQIELSTVSYERVVFTIRDKSFALDQNVQQTLYAGNNTGGNGIEGDANLNGQPKPLAYGRLRNVTPVLVNASRAMYQVHDGPVESIDNVYDGQTSFTFASNVADNAALQALTVAQGQYATCLAEGLIKIGNIPQRGLTVDLQGDNDGGYVNRAGAIVRRIIEDNTTLTTADLNTASFTAFDTAYNYETGIYIDTTRKTVDVISEALGALNFWTINRAGLISVGQFSLATGTPAEEYTVDETEQEGGNPIRRVVNNDETNGVPVYRLRYQYGRNYTVQTKDQLFGSVSLDTIAFTEREYRTVTNTDTAVQTRYPLSPEFTVTSQVFSATDANTDSTRVFDIYKTQRFFYSFTVDEEFASSLELNDVIRLTYPRFGLTNGALLRVVSITENALQSRTEIQAFG